MKRMLNRMLRYADAIVKRGVDKLINVIAHSADPQSENTETPRQQKRMGNDTDCGITLMDEQCDISYNVLDRTPEMKQRDQADKGFVPVSKPVCNTMLTASFIGAESDGIRILWCSVRFAANAEDIRTKGHKCFKTYGHGPASMCRQEHKGYAVTTLSVINKKATALNATASALMFLRTHGRESVSVCLEALMFLCSFVLMFSALAAYLITHKQRYT